MVDLEKQSSFNHFYCKKQNLCHDTEIDWYNLSLFTILIDAKHLIKICIHTLINISDKFFLIKILDSFAEKSTEML